jgi:peptidoglycan hydrolase CwlO-like protein
MIALYSQQDDMQDTVDELLDNLSRTMKEIAELEQNPLI